MRGRHPHAPNSDLSSHLGVSIPSTCALIPHLYDGPQESTDGSYIETKDSALVWNYRDADPDFGSWQVWMMWSYRRC